MENVATNNDDIQSKLILIETSKLSWNDDFMKYEPQTENQRNFKRTLKRLIRQGINDFYLFKMDPSFDENQQICYELEQKPAIGKSYNWWEKAAKEFCPDRNSRLCTKSEYLAFLGVLIKTLVNKGWLLEDAWNIVCDNSKPLGYYWHSRNGHSSGLEKTGSQEFYGFYDLANTNKIIAEDKDCGSFWITSGYMTLVTYVYPLISIKHGLNRIDGCPFSVGLILLEK